MLTRRHPWHQLAAWAILLAGCGLPVPSDSNSVPSSTDTITSQADPTSRTEVDWVVEVDLTDDQGTVNPLAGLVDRDPVPSLETIFPDPSASPDDPDAYDFAALDGHLATRVDEQATAIWRISGAGALLTEKPALWSRVIQRTLTHLNDGWADGHRWEVQHIEYTSEIQFDVFVEAIHTYNAGTRRDVQTVGPGIPIATQDLNAQVDVLAALLDRLEPGDLDYLSFHPQGRTPLEQQAIAQGVRRLLDSHTNGRYAQTGLWASDWTSDGPGETGTPSQLAALDTATRILWQPAVDFATLNQPDVEYFTPDGEAATAYFPFLAFEEISRETPNRVALANERQHRWPVLAARSPDAGRLSVLVAAPTAETEAYAIVLNGLPPGVRFRVAQFVVDGATTRWDARKRETIQAARDGSLLLEGRFAGPSVVYWRLEAE